MQAKKGLLSPLGKLLSSVIFPKSIPLTQGLLTTTPKLKTVGESQVLKFSEWAKYVGFGKYYTIRNWLPENYQKHAETIKRERDLQECRLHSQKEHESTILKSLGPIGRIIARCRNIA